MRSPSRYPVALALATIVVLAACTGGATPVPSGPPACPANSAADSTEGWGPPASPPPVIPIIVSQIQSCGENRFVFLLVDPQNQPIGAPDRSVSVAFYDLGADPGTPVATVEADFVWAIEDARGAYVANVDFTTYGAWGAEFRTTAPGSAETTVRLSFDVRATSPTLAVGQKAPASNTPILADVGGDVAAISTDPEPLAAFYETSVAAAVKGHEPFLLAFATPKFCVSAQCGPTLDRVKPLVAAYPTVRFINVEPYALQLVQGQLQPLLTDGQLTPVAAVTEWGLVSEPWIFVVDREGVIRGSFEGIVRTEELEAALDAVR